MGVSDSSQLGEDFSECIKIGILHGSSGRLLTAEVFNYELNVSGTALRRRQIWTLLVDRNRLHTVYLQSHLGRFLSADKDGKVSASALIPDEDERFILEFSPQSTGEWAFKSETHGFYLSGSETQITCFSKLPVWWAVRLATHPQIHLRHQFRSRYLRLLPNGTELRADQPHPWGSETLLWLEQLPMGMGSGPGVRGVCSTVGRDAVSKLGRVALRCENGRYLSQDGSLTDHMDESTLFAFELRPGSPRAYAFRDIGGSYLTAVGPGTAKFKSSGNGPGKEELFIIERAALQVGILANNNKFASVRQGVDVSANQHEFDETSTFQLEYIGGKGFICSEAIAASSTLPQTPGGDSEPTSKVPSATNGLSSSLYCLVTGHWRLRSNNGKLWRMASSAGVQNNAVDGDKESLFEILTLTDEANSGRGLVVLRSNSAGGGQTLSARKLGAISSSGRPVSESDDPTSTDLFRIILVNRPSIAFLSVLTGGFVSRGKQATLDCSSVSYDRFELGLTKEHTYQFFLRDQHGSYLLTASSDGFIHLKPTHRIPVNPTEAENDAPEPGTEFTMHFLASGRVIIRPVLDYCVGLNLVKAELKGDVKWESVTGDILVNYIWEI